MTELAALRIYLPTRPQGLLGAPGFPEAVVIEMDGRELTRLRNGENWACHVDPGRHVLGVRPPWLSKRPLDLVLAPGDDVQLETRISVWTGQFFLVRTDAATPDPPAPPLAVQVLGVTETHRSEEPIGTETRRIDSTSGVGRVTRTIRVTEEWSRMVSLDQQVSDSVATGIGIGPEWLALKTSIEQSLERTYAISVDHREEFAEEIGVEIEPGADVTVVLSWKRIWQHGIALVLTHYGQENVPYRMAVGVTFDQCIR